MWEERNDHLKMVTARSMVLNGHQGSRVANVHTSACFTFGLSTGQECSGSLIHAIRLVSAHEANKASQRNALGFLDCG